MFHSVYSLPKVQFKKKFKLTALEGSLIRKSKFSHYTNAQTQPFYCLTTLTNQGEIILFNLDQGKLVITDHRFENVIEKENLNGIFYSCLTADGQGLYLLSQSEFQRFSTSTRQPASTPCRISALWYKLHQNFIRSPLLALFTPPTLSALSLGYLYSLSQNLPESLHSTYTQYITYFIPIFLHWT